jgi:hypothetical protein
MAGVPRRNVKLHDRVLEGLAAMVVGDDGRFPYRSSSRITRFFQNAGFAFAHHGETRKWWTKDRLAELNTGPAQTPDLPSRDIVRVLRALFEVEEFDAEGKSIDSALDGVNELLKRTGAVVYLNAAGRAQVRSTGTGVSSASVTNEPRPLSADEITQRKMLETFLDTASEDDFVERMIVPFFQRLGFHRVSATGHKDKGLEYGKDLWWKFQLPTGHWIYFCAQAKRDKLDSSGAGGNRNVATVLNQALMALGHPIFDPDINRRVLLDHLFIISAGEITKQAKEWLVGQLDAGQRRHIVFMDRGEFLDHAARILLDLQLGEPSALGDGHIPF